MSKTIEEYSLNAWPALQTLVLDGWLLRFADGYTKRSNSINAIYAGMEENIGEKITKCEEIYSRSDLDVVFKITPFVPDLLDKTLENRGYNVLDPSSVKTLESLKNIKDPFMKDVENAECLNDKWLEIMSEFNGLSERNKFITQKLLSGLLVRKGYFILYNNSIPVACGLGAVEGNYVGLYDIVTSAHYRNHGYGEQLILNILNWAKSIGATKSYLLVVQNNMPAIKLYEKLNYREIYTYWYRCKRIL
ncbi:GNAT family N-acetyltransferase [Cohnella silvisoli]|uniref:GNAT family N-acetyltransferase n=1 Tax=Cohnella silvisoli TaxID=2873699 RepID=A0ABV1KQX9_9BACL|nr:GNAT family N-acetyltransferase [Cohnella silvisoli]MCD9022058.1 GNAT family N-acetyltransferase [Cohnella silvisoli]